MDKDGNDVIDNSKENWNKVRGNVAAQGNIYYQVLDNISVEEALIFILFIILYYFCISPI